MYNKWKYGEVKSDHVLINKMLDLLPNKVWSDPTLKWLDPGCGDGRFSWTVYDRLKKKINGEDVICNQLYMIELNREKMNGLWDLFGKGANIICGDFLSLKGEFDIIVGNPPFNSDGLKKVPTNTILSKKCDGITMWPFFVRHAISLLKEGGMLCMIIPSIWMRPDKANIYQLMMKYRMEKIHCFSNTETNRMFHGQCQTPTCYFVLYKEPARFSLSLYDNLSERLINYPIIKNYPIPVFGISIIKKLIPFIEKVGHLEVYKTNMPSKKAIICEKWSKETPYKNIRTCRCIGDRPYLVYEYSDIPLAYYGWRKIVMAHKMHGFPWYDRGGNMGISGRDNFVIKGKSEEMMERWVDFLSTNFARYVFEATRYRMKCLSKWAFHFIPNIEHLENFPEEITDCTIQEYFGLDENEKKRISCRKHYQKM